MFRNHPVLRYNLVTILMVIGLSILGWVVHQVFVTNPETETNQEQMDPITNQFSRLQQYQSPNLGDGQDVIHLNHQLPLGNRGLEFQLDAKKQIINVIHQESSKEVDKTLLRQIIFYNIAANFAMIDSLQEMRLSLQDVMFVVNRTDFEYFINTDISQLDNPIEWQSMIQSKLTDDDFLDRYLMSIVQVVEPSIV